MRSFWAILLFEPFIRPRGWMVQYRCNYRMAPKWGWLTPCEFIKPQPHPFDKRSS